MNYCRETMKMGVPPGNRPAVPRDWFRGVPERYVAGTGTRGCQEGRPYPWSQQVSHEISGLRQKDEGQCLGGPAPRLEIWFSGEISKVGIMLSRESGG